MAKFSRAFVLSQPSAATSVQALRTQLYITHQPHALRTLRASHRSASMPRARKVVLLGDFGVGKTSFGTRLAKGEFHESTLATLGVAHFNVAVRAAGDGPLAPATKLEIWDTAGQERYRSMDTLKLYLRGAAGAIVVADLTRAASFDAAVRVIEQIRGEEIGCKIPIALAANKSDLPSRQVEAAAVQAAAADLKLADARETSCKTGDGVLALARALVRALPPPEAPPETVELEGPTSSTACC